ncbi:MAG TPA: CBS domain-containing protein [Rhodocyclaceae bacterium]|nr:CBS domain-containing protein [Rhodocyclaceae bacterium]
MKNEPRAERAAHASSIAAEQSSVPDIEQGMGQRYHFLDDFLHLMFQPKSAIRVLPRTQEIRQREPQYQPLRQSKLRPNAGYHLPDPTMSTPVGSESPAIEVMTDLRRVAAVTVGRFASVNEANQTMIARGVRALFVVDDHYTLWGIITATDVLGGKPVQITQQRGIRHDEVTVRDIMTPVDRLEVIDLSDVLRARVGDVVLTLERSGRQHALVVDQSWDSAAGQRQMVRGIFSLTQIARQLGITPQGPEIGSSFAEIAAAIRS